MAQILDYRSAPPAAPLCGVYYAPADARGVFVRLLIAAIDTAVAVGLIVGTAAGLAAIGAGLSGHGAVVGVGLAVAYLTVLKCSVGTIGYRMFNVRVLGLNGRRPGPGRMLWRLGLSLVFNSALDLLWLASDDSRQTLRDKLSGTYVVRRAAVPAGEGPLVWTRVFLWNMSLLYREVSRQ